MAVPLTIIMIIDVMVVVIVKGSPADMIVVVFVVVIVIGVREFAPTAGNYFAIIEFVMFVIQSIDRP